MKNKGNYVRLGVVAVFLIGIALLTSGCAKINILGCSTATEETTVQLGVVNDSITMDPACLPACQKLYFHNNTSEKLRLMGTLVGTDTSTYRDIGPGGTIGPYTYKNDDSKVSDNTVLIAINSLFVNSNYKEFRSSIPCAAKVK